jgi:hypothetical protein
VKGFVTIRSTAFCNVVVLHIKIKPIVFLARRALLLQTALGKCGVMSYILIMPATRR